MPERNRRGISLNVFEDTSYATIPTMFIGACVCWFSWGQKCVIFSTIGAEYVAL